MTDGHSRLWPRVAGTRTFQLMMMMTIMMVMMVAEMILMVAVMMINTFCSDFPPGDRQVL